MSTQQNATVSPNAVTYEGKSFNKKDVHTIEYKEPKSMAMSIISNVSQYSFLIILVVGIPFAVMAIMRDTKKHRVILTLKEHDSKGKKKIVTWYVSKEESDYIRENY
jgi:hypothetical protein